MEALEGEDVTEVSSWSILLLLPEMKSSSIWSMHCRRWSWKEEAIRGHLGDYNEAGSFVSAPTRQETVCPSNLFHFLDSISSVFVDWELISDLKVR